MKLFIFLLGLIATTLAEHHHAPSQEYLPPTSGSVGAASAPAPAVAHAPAKKAAPQHIAAAATQTHAAVAPAPSGGAGGLSGLDIQEIPLVAEFHSTSGGGSSGGGGGIAAAASEPEPAHTLAEDGYRYKTHRAKKYRFRTNRRRRVRVH